MIKMPESLYDDLEKLRKTLDMPTTSGLIRMLIREGIYNHNARHRLSKAADAHDKDEIKAIAREIAAIYDSGRRAFDDEFRPIDTEIRRDTEVHCRSSKEYTDEDEREMLEKFEAGEYEPRRTFVFLPLDDDFVEPSYEEACEMFDTAKKEGRLKVFKPQQKATLDEAKSE